MLVLAVLVRGRLDRPRLPGRLQRRRGPAAPDSPGSPDESQEQRQSAQGEAEDRIPGDDVLLDDVVAGADRHKLPA